MCEFTKNISYLNIWVEGCVEGSISKTVMIGLPSDQIGDFENTSIFPQRGKIDSVSGLALLSPWSRNHARFGLQTVFSITQPDHSIPLVGSSAITVLEMYTVLN